MRQITVFEGYYDLDAGWDFDMPIIMVHPIYRWGEGGNPGYVDTMVEDYMIDWIFNGGPPESEYFEPHDLSIINREFEAARQGKPKYPDQHYWKRVVEWDPDDDDAEVKILESIG